MLFVRTDYNDPNYNELNIINMLKLQIDFVYCQVLCSMLNGITHSQCSSSFHILSTYHKVFCVILTIFSSSPFISLCSRLKIVLRNCWTFPRVIVNTECIFFLSAQCKAEERIMKMRKICVLLHFNWQRSCYIGTLTSVPVSFLCSFLFSNKNSFIHAIDMQLPIWFYLQCKKEVCNWCKRKRKGDSKNERKMKFSYQFSFVSTEPQL